MINTFPEYNGDVSKIDSMIDKIINLKRDTYPTRTGRGFKIWYNKEGEEHREGGPAVIWPNGREEYWINGSLHRTDGPAIIENNGYQAYFQYGKKHRLDGPAVIYVDSEGSQEEYWEYGKKI